MRVCISLGYCSSVSIVSIDVNMRVNDNTIVEGINDPVNNIVNNVHNSIVYCS